MNNSFIQWGVIQSQTKNDAQEEGFRENALEVKWLVTKNALIMSLANKL